MSASIRNRLRGTIEKIVSDKVVSEIVIRTEAGTVTSVITTGSVQRMNLKEDDAVFAVIKATEVSVEKEQPFTARWSVHCIAAKSNSVLQAALDAFYLPSQRRDCASTLR